MHYCSPFFTLSVSMPFAMCLAVLHSGGRVHVPAPLGLDSAMWLAFPIGMWAEKAECQFGAYTLRGTVCFYLLFLYSCHCHGKDILLVGYFFKEDEKHVDQIWIPKLQPGVSPVSWHPRLPNCQPTWKRTSENKCCFMLLSFRVVCYIALLWN